MYWNLENLATRYNFKKSKYIKRIKPNLSAHMYSKISQNGITFPTVPHMMNSSEKWILDNSSCTYVSAQEKTEKFVKIHFLCEVDSINEVKYVN